MVPNKLQQKINVHLTLGFPGGTSGIEAACQCKRHKRYRCDPWVRKIPGRKAWQPTPVFLSGEPHGQRSLAGCSPQGRKESDTTERLSTHAYPTPDGLSLVPLQPEVLTQILLLLEKANLVAPQRSPPLPVMAFLLYTTGSWCLGPSSRLCSQLLFLQRSRTHPTLPDLPASPAEPAVGRGSASEPGRETGSLRWRPHTSKSGQGGTQLQACHQTQLLTWPIRVHQFTSKYSQSLFTSLENDCPFPENRTLESHSACDSEKLFLQLRYRSSHCASCEKPSNYLMMKDT